MKTVSLFIIYYLYAFDNITTLQAEWTLLLERVHLGMQDDLTLPKEFEHAKIPEINIRQGVPKLPGSHFCDYSREMQEAHCAHLIECDAKAIPFLCVLIGYIKELKLTTPIWGVHTHITKTVDWDSSKGDISQFIRMSQDHTCHNMSATSIEVQGISDIKASAVILCPVSGYTLGHLSLQQTLMKYLKLHNGTLMYAKVHQQGPQSPVDMVIPNTSAAEERFEMFNKQSAGYLYHVLPTFGASSLFAKTILCQSMEAGLATETPLCTYDPEIQIRMTPPDAVQDGILSDVCSLPFFQDVLAEKQAADATKKGKKKKHTAPDMCFQLGSACSVQTVHGSDDGKYTTVIEPGTDLGLAIQASTAKPPNADQPSIKIASTANAFLVKGARGGETLHPPLTIHPHCLLVKRKSNPWRRPAADSPLQLPSLHHGRVRVDKDLKWCV